MMAEIFHGVASCGAEAAAMSSCESGSLAKIERRMDMRSLKFVPGTETHDLVEMEPSTKRRRLGEAGDATAECKENSERSASGSTEPSPVVASEGLKTSDRCPRYGASEVCGRRRDMEDAVSIRPDFLRQGDLTLGKHHFFGVFDGHGCSHVRCCTCFLPSFPPDLVSLQLMTFSSALHRWPRYVGIGCMNWLRRMW